MAESSDTENWIQMTFCTLYISPMKSWIKSNTKSANRMSKKKMVEGTIASSMSSSLAILPGKNDDLIIMIQNVDNY